VVCITAADQPRPRQFCIGINRRPGPNVSVTLSFLCFGSIALFGHDKGPDILNLKPVALQISKCSISIVVLSFAEISDEFQGCIE
jgi:hypothetical protein